MAGLIVKSPYIKCGGVAAGGLLSGTVNDLGAEILYSWGLQRRALPKAIKSGANAVAYAIGETGGGELGRMATEENYTPDWQAIGKRGASAFAFGFASELLKSAALSARDKAYLRENLSDAQKSYEAAMDSLTDPLATSEQQQKLAQRALDHADWARNQLDEINVSDRAAEQARAALTDAIEELRPLAAGNSPFGLDSSGIPSNNTLDLGQKGSFGERMVGQISGNPLVFGEYDSPASLKAALEGAGFEVKPLGKGAFSNTPFESGGGYRINFSDGGLLQYHPEAHSHHGGAYYKISTGKGGTHHYDIGGNEKVIL